MDKLDKMDEIIKVIIFHLYELKILTFLIDQNQILKIREKTDSEIYEDKALKAVIAFVEKEWNFVTRFYGIGYNFYDSFGKKYTEVDGIFSAQSDHDKFTAVIESKRKIDTVDVIKMEERIEKLIKLRTNENLQSENLSYKYSQSILNRYDPNFKGFLVGERFESNIKEECLIRNLFIGESNGNEIKIFGPEWFNEGLKIKRGSMIN